MQIQDLPSDCPDRAMRQGYAGSTNTCILLAVSQSAPAPTTPLRSAMSQPEWRAAPQGRRHLKLIRDCLRPPSQGATSRFGTLTRACKRHRGSSRPPPPAPVTRALTAARQQLYCFSNLLILAEPQDLDVGLLKASVTKGVRDAGICHRRTSCESAVPIQPCVSGVAFFDETSGSKADPPGTGLRCVLYIN